MNDTEIIYRFIKVSIPDNHPAIYQYIEGGSRSQISAVNNILKVADVLTPPYTVGHIKTVIRRFLKEKQEQHRNGEIYIKPIY